MRLVRKKDWADRAVVAIVKDLSDRRGIKSEWSMIDRGLRIEIQRIWAELIRQSVENP